MVYTQSERNDRYKAAFGMAVAGGAIAFSPILMATEASSPEMAALQALAPALIGAKLLCPALTSMFNPRSRIVDGLAKQWASPLAAGLLFAGMAGGAHIDHHSAQREAGTWPPTIAAPITQ